MRKAVIVLASVFIVFSGGTVSAASTSVTTRGQSVQEASPVIGEWLAQTRDGVFRILACGDALCGQLVGMDYDGPVPHDVLGRSQCGLTMLTSFHPEDDGRWKGAIFDPGSGKVYDALIWNVNHDTLKLRGYILDLPLLGRTQTWTRFHGKIGANCKMEK